MSEVSSGVERDQPAHGGVLRSIIVSPKQRRRDLIAVNIGNMLEWFDWNIYAIFAPFFAAQFFDSTDPLSATLSTLAIFAVGFLMRPVGGWLFGRLADERGRRFSLSLAIGLAAVGSLVIAISPNFESIGVWASVVLLLARLLQGLSHGGETGTAFTYLAEIAPRHRRAAWASSPWIGVALGTIMATGLGAILTAAMSKTDMLSFGWRIPFFIGAIFGLYALYIRTRMTESGAFESAVEATNAMRREAAKDTVADPVFTAHAKVLSRAERAIVEPRMVPLLWRERRAVLHIASLSMSGVVTFYTWFIFAPAHAVTTYGMESSAALVAGLLGQSVFLLALPVMAWASDKFGRRPVVWVFSIGFVVAAVPLEMGMGKSPLSLFCTMAIASILLAAISGPLGAVFAELVPTKVRATVVGITYATSAAIFGGTAPYLNTWLSSQGLHMGFVIYIMALCMITAVITLRMPETRGVELR